MPLVLVGLKPLSVWALTLPYIPIAVATTPARSLGLSGTITMFEAFATAGAIFNPATVDEDQEATKAGKAGYAGGSERRRL